MKTTQRSSRLGMPVTGTFTRIAAAALTLFGLAMATACSTANQAGTRVGNPPTISTTEAYPSNLAITSPLESSTEFTSELPALTLYQTSASGVFDTAYSAATGRINSILNGSAAEDCSFFIEPILNQQDDASCYGPEIDYEFHPDYDTSAQQSGPQNGESGQLPPGDVGLWTPTENGTPQACAAAELNARMRSLESKSQVALEALASLICVARVNGIDVPENGALDLLEEMRDMAEENDLGISLSTADLSVSASGDETQYSYDLVFEYVDNEGNAHDIEIQMTHVPRDEDGTSYRGRFSYTVGGVSSDVGNGCEDEQMTEAGSVLYDAEGASSRNFQALHAAFCGANADAVQADGLIHADDKLDLAANPDGWTHDFTSTTADFDPTTGAGNYAFGWQAGLGDDNTRVFNLTLEEDEGLAGTAFFGFGDEMEDFDGSIQGFICNWAGPGNTHQLQDYAQRQGITQVGSEEFFLSIAGELNIGYAPTNSCQYNGMGNFTYDSDADGTVDTDPSLPVANDLLPLTDADGDGVFDEIDAAGFVLPAAPENF